MWAGRMTFSGNPGRSSHSLRPPRAGALPRLGSELERKGGAFPLGPAVSTFGRLERLAAGRPAKPARPAGGGSGGSLRPPRPPHGWRPTMTTQGFPLELSVAKLDRDDVDVDHVASAEHGEAHRLVDARRGHEALEISDAGDRRAVHRHDHFFG